MSYTAAKRNSATSTSGSISVVSRAQATTVTSTVAGDVGILAVSYQISGNFSRTWTPPAGFILVTDNFDTVALLGVAVFVNFNMKGSITSYTVTLALTGTQRVFGVGVIYVSWAGGGSGSTQESLVTALNDVGASTIPPITSGVMGAIGDLVLVVLAATIFSSFPGNPTGTGTWTSAATLAEGASSSFQGMRVSAQIGAPSATATASGATISGSSNSNAIIFGITPAPKSSGMFAFFEK